jgi:hypothetical protein
VTPQTLDALAAWVGLILTLLIFSYLIADNFLYRLAVYVFVGVAAGFAAVVAVEGVLLPWLRGTLLATGARSVEQIVLGIVPLLVGLLLMVRAYPPLRWVGNLGMAFLIGIGTAVALVGTISGTLLPLVLDTGAAIGDDLINGLVIILGTITSLLYFQFIGVRRTTPEGEEVQRPLALRAASTIGQVFLIVTFAALYAGAIIASLTVFSERVAFILTRITG